MIALRAIADYVPANDQSKPGQDTPPVGAHPLMMLSATIAVFFVLSIAARAHSQAGRVAIMFGGLMDLGLMANSQNELNTVSLWFASTSPTKGTTLE